ncbi:nuclear protein 96 domain-containing protein [Hirsutella rhossiliensis]|uniref:Nuclear protein 96 domain-containing protein n=1 Tax=Hirsutella rhossiliensis TaxID=111463 RepID=A0A9P8MT03_9HYPO|nr:nuclear protein 96 domain-containing protein [Hirsutella rhossiliensis]KAH0961603.1 nuclear protein 96 domain-containing protein [Hirsutella rhossiliensis]
MSFGSGGFGGFGSNNNQTSSFGSTNASGGFGQSANTGGGMFGGNANAPGFGGSSSGFGANTTASGFGSKPAFGSSTTAPGGFLGSSNTNNASTTGFGGSMFASNANKTGFGATSNTGSSLFGGGAASSGSGFGGGGFGAANNPGLGGGVGDPPGTATTPFQALTEKEPNSTNQSNSFQNILFQDPYRKWSAEELRLADYVQGRRHGNASGAGAFGTPSAFGGASNAAPATTGGLFGSGNANNTTTAGFGQTGASAFGGNASNTSGGLFGGNNKPSGGLFGNTANQQSGGLFGSGSGGGFGATNNTSTFGATNNAATGGLFGSNNQANKPQGSGFSFGNTNANNAPSGFGATSGGAFGAASNTTGSGLFGGTNNTQQSGGGLFGNNQQPQQNAGSGFGAGFGTQNTNQQTSGGVFGNTNNQQPATGAFGTNTTTPAAGGLFGASKPSTGNSLFGGANTGQANNAGGAGMFGGLGSNAPNQQAAGSSLFGATNNAQQKPGGLFGSTNQTSTPSLFGGQSTQNQGGSLFGNNPNQQQTQASGFGGSLLGSSQQGGNAPQGLTANLNDVSAYGSPSLFAGVSGNEVSNPGPLATPLSGNPKPRRSSILPMYKLAPAAASRFATPQKRGFGFSYSSSAGTLSKSMSTNNLRRSFNTEDSILAPGAFSSSSNARWYGSTGSKKLVINRDIRSDLFSTPQKDRQAVDGNSSARKLSKRVSFDTSNVEAEDETPVRNALPAPEGTPGSQTDESTPRQNRPSVLANGSKTPETEQVKGNELAIVHEEDSTATPEAQTAVGLDNAPGNYWMVPSKEELLNMNRMQRQRIDGFTIGRANVGFIKFKIPVDISGIEIDELSGGVIQLEPRSATVYPNPAKKPPVGKGLNVPARITLEHSWPRAGRDKQVANDPKRFKKHVERLKRIPDTTFEEYNQETGIWTFSVEHFTTYGLDDSDDESDGEEVPQVTGGPEPAPPAQPTSLGMNVDSAMEDDTFEFNHPKGVPGAFDQQEDLYTQDLVTGKQSFLGVSSADSASNVRLSLDEYNSNMDDGYDVSEDEDMTRSSVGLHHAAERDDASSENDPEAKRSTPGGILRARMRAMKDSVGPVQLEVADGDDWMEMLRKTVSPVKRDRQMLRELNESPSKLTGEPANLDDDGNLLRKSSIWGQSPTKTDRASGLAARSQMAMDKGHGFATSIDLMNSLFEKPRPARQNLGASLPTKGFPQWPYERQDKTLIIDEGEQAFHNASRPTWGPGETLLLTRALDTKQPGRLLRDTSDVLALHRSGVQTLTQELRFGKFSTAPSRKFLRAQDELTDIRLVDGVPLATLHAATLQDLFHREDLNDPANLHEQRVWELASILFDRASPSVSAETEHLSRKTRLSRFWADLVEQASATNIGLAGTCEEKVVACLAGHRITEACKYLLEGKNLRLGTLVPLIGTCDAAKKDMKEQLRAWYDAKMLSEFSDAIRTIYELLSGNACVCEGMKGVPVEDRLESFVISKKFGLDWRQSFGLRLWYAIAQQDSAAAAVMSFKEDIGQDREDLPRPWRQDLLWGLLQLYADEHADLEAILRPENSQLSPLDMRLSWQLGLALVSTGKVSFGQGEAAKADASTMTYAAQLTAAGEWLEAVFVLLHLRDATARTKAIREHICRHAGLVGPDSGTVFAILTEKFQIPATWLWEAEALYMRSVKKDASAEVHCLLRAGSFTEAHRVLVQQVAPRAIIERDYVSLSALISQFEGRQDSIPDWSLGGDMYSSFLTLVLHRGKGEGAPAALLEKLLAGLRAMHDGVGESELMRYAAVSDMADETARELLKLAVKKKDMELRSRILNLPLTQDRLLAYSVELSMDCYRAVMSH